MNESKPCPTPRTDAFAEPCRGLGTGYYQALDFARTLEVELIATQLALKKAGEALVESDKCNDCSACRKRVASVLANPLSQLAMKGK